MRGRHRQRDTLPSEKRRKQKLTSPAPKQQQTKRKKTRKQKREEEESMEILRRRRVLMRAGKLVPQGRSKWRTYSWPIFSSPPDPLDPTFYEDIPFTCKDCGKQEMWTAHQQKWWYEEIGGNIETTAVRCTPCRAKERARKAEVNRLRLEGLERKRQRLLKRPWG